LTKTEAGARRLIKNTAALGAGQIGTRALGFVYLTALARYVHPEGMGQLATAQSLATIAALLVSLGHETMTISELARDRSQGTVWFSNLLALKLVLSILALGGLLVCSWITHYPAATQEIIMVYGVVVVVGALVTAVRTVIMAREQLTIEAATQFGRDAINIGLSLLAIWLGASLVVIVWVSVVANVVQLIVELLVMRWLRLASLIAPTLAQMRMILRGGLPFGAGAVISVVLAQAGPVLLSVLAGADATGEFWAANNIVQLLLVLPITYYWAVLPVFSRLQSSEEAGAALAYRSSIKVITVVGMPLAIGTAILAEPFVDLLYGSGFEVSALTLRILIVTVALSADYVCGAALTAMGRQRFLVITYGLELVALVGLSLVLVPRWGALGVGVGYAAPRVVGFACRLAASFRELHQPLPLEMLARVASAAGLMGIVVHTGYHAGVNFLLLAGGVGPVAYVAGLLVFGAVNRQEWRMMRQTLQFR
jgi:O-antigen/teichoic acid export membrane protein